MKTYIELWKARPAWHALSEQERSAYMDNIGPAIQVLMEKGIKILSWGVNDRTTHNRADYDYFGVWRVPDVATAREFEAVVDSAGWYNYFEQVNVMGDEQSPEAVIPEMIAE